MELLLLRRLRELVNVGCCCWFDALLPAWAAAAAAAAAVAVALVEDAEPEEDADDFEPAVFEDGDGGVALEEALAALCARKATSRFARRGRLVGMTLSFLFFSFPFNGAPGVGRVGGRGVCAWLESSREMVGGGGGGVLGFWFWFWCSQYKMSLPRKEQVG